MADFGGAPVGLQSNPNQGLQTLSQILNIQNAQQQLQTGQAVQQSAQADAQKKTQAMQERLKIAQMMKSGMDDQGNSIRNAQGEPDPARILPALGRIAPLTGQEVAQSIIKTQTDKVGLQAASTGLDAAQRKLLMGPVQAAALDSSVKSSDVNAGIDNLVQAHPEMGNAAGYLKGLVAHLDTAQTPEQRAHLANRIAAQIQPGEAVETQPQNAAVNTGAAQMQGTVTPPAAGGGFTPVSQTRMQPPPGFDVVVDPRTQNPYLLNRQSGEARDMGYGFPNSKAASGAAPPSSIPPPQSIGEKKSLEDQAQANFENVSANRRGGALAPQQLDQIDKALELSSQTNAAGDWTAKRVQLEANLSSLIPGLAKARDDASKVQELDKFLTRVTNDSTKMLGANPSTDAERESIAHQNAQIGFTPPAIQNVLTYAKAQTLAMQAKADAQENWFKQPGNKITNQHEFETQWRQAYDPVLFQIQAAKPEARRSIIQNLPPDEAGRLAKQRALLKQFGVAQ